MRVHPVQGFLCSCFLFFQGGFTQPSPSSSTANTVISIDATEITLTPEKEQLFTDFMLRKVQEQERVARRLELLMEAGRLPLKDLEEPQLNAAYYMAIGRAIAANEASPYRILLRDVAIQYRIPVGLPLEFLELPLKTALKHAKRISARVKSEGLTNQRSSREEGGRTRDVETWVTHEAESAVKDIEFLMTLFDMKVEDEE